MNPQELKIAIIGGGPGGLATAIALHRSGFRNLIVYERDTNADARKQGYSFSLFGPSGGLPLLQKLGLMEQMSEFSFETVGFRMMDAETGNALIEISKKVSPTISGITESRRVLRGGLRKLLVKTCDDQGIPIIWDAKFSSYEERDDGSIVLHFDNQPDWTVDLLIGADGVHSPVRQQLVGDQVLYSGFTGVMYVVNKSESPELAQHPWVHGSGGFTLGNAESMFFYHHPPSDEIHWAVTQKIPEEQIVKECQDDQEKLLNIALNFAKKFPRNELIQKMVHATKIGHASIIEFKDRDPLKVNKKTGRLFHSRTGCITLLGDAAHPMTPFRAAGGNNALMDALKLTDELGNLLHNTTITTTDIHQALSSYEKEMGPRGEEAILTSRNAAHSTHSANSVTNFLRYYGMRLINWKLHHFNGSSLQTATKAVTAGTIMAAIAFLAMRYDLVHKYIIQ